MPKSVLRKNIYAQYGLQLAKYIFPFITLPYLARVLGPDGYAIRSYVLGLMTFFQTFADFGFGPYGTRLVIEEKGRKGGLSRIFSLFLWAKLFLILPLFVVLCVVMYSLPLLESNSLYVVLSFGVVVLTSFLPDYIFQGFQQMEELTKRFVAMKAIVTIATFILIDGFEDLLLVPILDIAGCIFALCWTMVVIKKRYGITLVRVKPSESIRYLVESASYFLSNICSTILNSFTIVFVGAAITNSVEIAVWSMSMTVVSAIQSLYTPLSNSLYPHVLASKELSSVKKIILIFGPLTLIATIVIAVCPNAILLLFGGAAYSGYGLILAALSPIILISFFTIIFGWPVMGGLGLVRELGATSGFAALFTIGALLICAAVGEVGIILIALIRVMSELLLLIARAVFVFKALKRFPKEA